MLWSGYIEQTRAQFSLWLWFITECLDSVMHIYL